jgi:hypothetical protein
MRNDWDKIRRLIDQVVEAAGKVKHESRISRTRR